MFEEKDEIQNKLDQANKLIENGDSFQNLKDFKNAIQCYTTAITLYSEVEKCNKKPRQCFHKAWFCIFQ